MEGVSAAGKTTTQKSLLSDVAPTKLDRGSIGYGGSDKYDLSSLQKVMCGGLAGAFCRLVTNPLDLVKIRFQLQAEPISKNVNHLATNSKYTGLGQAFKQIYKEEGFMGYYKGHMNGQLLSISCSIVQYGTYEVTSRLLYQIFGMTNNHINSFFAGYASAFNAILVCYPFDILRTRFSSQPSFYYKSNFHAAQDIFRADGIRGFYKGLVPAVLSQAPQSSLYFSLYSVLKSCYNYTTKYSELDEVNVQRTFICSFSAGWISKIIMFPCDLVKKRLQIQGFETGRKQLGKTYEYNGAIHCFKTIVKYEGVRGLYKGLAPGLIKAAFVSSSSTVSYEIIKNFTVTWNMKNRHFDE
ncbi:MAG: hypothetical protein MHPSP_001351 [Paramarteilia canceri]